MFTLLSMCICDRCVCVCVCVSCCNEWRALRSFRSNEGNCVQWNSCDLMYLCTFCLLSVDIVSEESRSSTACTPATG